MVKIAPSILAANFENLEDEIKSVQDAGADYIHIDVMDGRFVNNTTPGLEMLNRSHLVTNLVLDTHLMVENPEQVIDLFSKSDIITFHIEAVEKENVSMLINKIHSLNIKVGIAIKPGTSVQEIVPYLDIIDMALVMTVEPGFGGQKMIKSCLEKVKEIRKISKDIDIEVDGGINKENIDEVLEAGANVIVAGTAIFKAENRTEAINKLKNS